MLGRVTTIALNAYRESVRARILIGLAGVAFAVAFYAMVVGSFTLDNAPRVVSDLGAASISIFSIAVAIVIGATSLHRELEQKTIFPILARPISRPEYLVGKYLGTLLTIAVFILADAGLVMLLSATLADRPLGLVAGSGLGSVAVLIACAIKWPTARTFGLIPWAFVLFSLGFWLSGAAPDERRVVASASALALFEVAIIAAVATLFSSFSTPFLSALLTFGIFLVGRDADSLANLPIKQFGQALHDVGSVLSKLVPNLHVYVPPRPLLTGEALDADLPRYMLGALGSSLGWAVVLLAIASLVFKKRDFL